MQTILNDLSLITNEQSPSKKEKKKFFFFLKIKLRMGNDCIQPFAQFSNTAFSTSFSRIFIGWVTALSLGKQLDQTIGTT